MNLRSVLLPVLLALGACTPNTNSADGGSGGGGGGASGGGSGGATGGGGGLGMTDGGEPAYVAANHRLILRDDFDGYADMAAAARAYPVGRDTQFCELVSGRGGNGKAVRLNYGAPSWGEDVLFGPETRLDAVGGWNGTLPEVAGPYRHFFFTTWFRVSVGSDPAENDLTGSGLKGLMFWHGTGRYQNAVNRLQQPGDVTRGPKGANPDNATSGLNLYLTPDGRALLWSSLADGQWHRFTIEIFSGNHPSGHFGERFWVDGAPVYSDVDVPVGPATSIGHYDYAEAITHRAVFGNFIDTAAKSNHFTIDFDDWMAWTD